MCREADFEKFCSLLDALSEGGPGPDGLPYSAFTKGGLYPREVLYQTYLQLINTDTPLIPGFNHSLLVLLAKTSRKSRETNHYQTRRRSNSETHL